ncbi:MAG: oligopeptide ABC transporter ATP-binding protein, partial [Thermoprotei archaeon]
STTKYFSNRIHIMYAGKIVEGGPSKEVIHNPQHPYTKYLINALPDPDPNNRFVKRDVPPGEPPSLINPPPGCRFHPRCPLSIKDLCDVKEPGYTYINEHHFVKCWYYEKGG